MLPVVLMGFYGSLVQSQWFRLLACRFARRSHNGHMIGSTGLIRTFGIGVASL